MEQNIIFKQLFDNESSTFTYLIADTLTREAVIIDPVREQINRDLQLLKELQLKLKYILETHIHADHITSSGKLRQLNSAQIALSRASQSQCADILLDEGDNLFYGKHKITAITTPGHTNSCMSYQTGNFVFTGDTLLIRGCGRTDFQEGSSENLFNSVRKKLFSLPEETIIYPGHDYKGLTASTIYEEKYFNPRLNLKLSQQDFEDIMHQLKLSYPQKIHEALPLNLNCGLEL